MAQYVISIDPIETVKTSSSYVGKLKPLKNSNGFTLYDNGNDAKNELDKPLRCEIGYIFYVFIFYLHTVSACFN